MAAAASGEGAGGGHCVLLTGTVAWCRRCGASACVQARNLTRPCPGQARGFLAHARQRLLLGLHPCSRVPLGACTVAEPGKSLPVGFSIAVQKAEASRTVAAVTDNRRMEVPECVPARRSLVSTPRLAALRERVLAKQAGVHATALSMLPLKRRRLWRKQPSHGTPGSTLDAVPTIAP